MIKYPKFLLKISLLVSSLLLSCTSLAMHDDPTTKAWIEVHILNNTNHIGHCTIVEHRGHHTRLHDVNLPLIPGVSSTFNMPWHELPTHSKNQAYTNEGMILCETFAAEGSAGKPETAQFHFHGELTNRHHTGGLHRAWFGYEDRMDIVKEDLSITDNSPHGAILYDELRTNGFSDSEEKFWQIWLSIY